MFQSRIKQLQTELGNFEIEALLITSSYNIAYLTDIHAFSIEEREARILVTKQNCYLFTDARYTQMVKEKAPFVSLIEISSSKSFSKSLSEIIKNEKIKSLGFEEANITYKEISNIEEKIHDVDFVPTEDIIESLRETKDNDEVEKIKQACQLTDKAFEFILGHLKPGVTELEIKAKLENFIRLQNGNISFESIIAFGNNAAIPHHMSTTYQLQTTTCILLDFGAKVDGYCSDMTRTIFIGEPTKEFQKMYTATKEAQELAIDYLKTHMKEGFETKKAHELANSHLKAIGFDPIPHGLGHGVGLQVHEQPSLSPYSEDGLKPGMIVTVEPGVYIPNLGGIRIEDTALITTDGIDLLTKSTKEVTII